MADELRVSRLKLRGLIRSLGVVLGIVAGAPSVGGCFYLVFNPSELIEHLDGAAFCFVIGSIVTFSTYRWITIGGEASERLIVLRGWFRSSVVFPDQLAEIRTIRFSSTSSSAKSYYVLLDHDGNKIGFVPTMVMACENWDKFFQHLQKLAADSRKRHSKGSPNKPRSIADKPVDEWTLEDMERYEQEH